jgi:hypothetical protein
MWNGLPQELTSSMAIALMSSKGQPKIAYKDTLLDIRFHFP